MSYVVVIYFFFLSWIILFYFPCVCRWRTFWKHQGYSTSRSKNKINSLEPFWYSSFFISESLAKALNIFLFDENDSIFVCSSFAACFPLSFSFVFYSYRDFRYEVKSKQLLLSCPFCRSFILDSSDDCLNCEIIDVTYQLLMALTSWFIRTNAKKVMCQRQKKKKKNRRKSIQS